MTVQQDLQRCIQDTHVHISPQAANRLKAWTDYSDQQIAASIKRAIRNNDNIANGWTINHNGGVSLESIVLAHENLFNDEDRNIARRNLGITE